MALVVKNLPAIAGDIRDVSSIPWSGRTLEEGMEAHSSIFAWRILMDRGIWRAIVHKITKSQTQLKWFSTQACADLNWKFRAVFRSHYLGHQAVKNGKMKIKVWRMNATVDKENISKMFHLHLLFSPLFFVFDPKLVHITVNQAQATTNLRICSFWLQG